MQNGKTMLNLKEIRQHSHPVWAKMMANLFRRGIPVRIFEAILIMEENMNNRLFSKLLVSFLSSLLIFPLAISSVLAKNNPIQVSPIEPVNNVSSPYPNIQGSNAINLAPNPS